MNKNRRHFLIVGVLVIVFTVLVDLVLETVLQWPVQGSAEALVTDSLFGLHLKLISFLFSLITVFVLYSLVVFRRRPGDDGDGEYMHGDTRLEILWTVVPLIVVVFFGFLGTTTLNEITAASPDEMVVKVIGFQWAWRFEYPEEGIVGTELVLPVDRRVRLEMTSNDVIHSFFVPEMRVKQDLVPGQTTELRFTPILEGEYVVRCTELCGLSHATMVAPVRIVSQDEYDAWRAERTASAD